MTRIRLRSITRRIYFKTLMAFGLLFWLFNFHSRSQAPQPSSHPIDTIDPKVVIAIMANWQEMNALIKASKNTWIADLSYDVFFFVGVPRELNVTFVMESNIVLLPYDDYEYPPVNKTFAMWRYLYENHAMEYEYFAAADTDTYVNVKKLEIMIKQLKCKDCYVGYPVLSNTTARSLGLHAPYCSGLGYVISRSTLLQFGPHLDTCRRSIVKRHSDTEMGRCIYEHVHNLSCSKPSISFGLLLYTADENNERITYRVNKRKQMYIDFPQSPPTRLFEAVMVHPLKEPHFFYKFHEQLKLNLRPILSPVFAYGSCVANPILQREIHPKSTYIPECPPLKTNKSIDVKSLDAFILTLPGFEKRVQRVVQAFSHHGVHVQHFELPSYAMHSSSTNELSAQRRLRMIMTDFFHMALSSKYLRVLVLEDTAIPHRHFGSLLQQILLDNRCGQYMLDDYSGGIMMLGATVGEEEWIILDKLGRKETGLCKNICRKSSNSFAVIYHRATFKTILSWLNTSIDEPYDHVFTYLNNLGYPVRFANPNLVIKDVRLGSPIRQSFDSSIENNLQKHADVHRWVLTDYMIT